MENKLFSVIEDLKKSKYFESVSGCGMIIDSFGNEKKNLSRRFALSDSEERIRQERERDPKRN